MKYSVAFLVSVVTLASLSPAQAATTGVVVNQGTQPFTAPNGTNTLAYDSPGERGGGGSTAVTSAAPRAAAGTPGANGSLQINGDRSRYVIGSIYETFQGATAPSLAPLQAITQLAFDWQTAVVGSSQAHAAPAVRFHIMDNGIRSEMIWENVYNGGTAGVAPATGWQDSGLNALFYVNVRDNDGAAFLTQNSGTPGLSINGGSQGEVYRNGALLTQSISDWKSLYSSNAIITGLSFGAGSGFGSNFVGYIDNVRVGDTSGNTFVINFETSAAAAVPEPATWAMMIGGFGLVGGMARRRRVTLRTV